MEDEVRQFVNDLTKSYREIIQDILSNCDSVIERKLIMYLLERLVNWKLTMPGYLVFETDVKFTNPNSQLFKYPQNRKNYHPELSVFRFSAFSLRSDFTQKIKPVTELGY